MMRKIASCRKTVPSMSISGAAFSAASSVSVVPIGNWMLSVGKSAVHVTWCSRSVKAAEGALRVLGRLFRRGVERAAVLVHLDALRRVGALVRAVAHAVEIGVGAGGRRRVGLDHLAAVHVHLGAARGVGAAILRVGDAVAVAVRLAADRLEAERAGDADGDLLEGGVVAAGDQLLEAQVEADLDRFPDGDP